MISAEVTVRSIVNFAANFSPDDQRAQSFLKLIKSRWIAISTNMETPLLDMALTSL
jgi:hypothetical protein